MPFSLFFVLSPIALLVLAVEMTGRPVASGLLTLSYLGLLHIAAERWRPSEPQPRPTLSAALRGAVHALIYSFLGGILVTAGLHGVLSWALPTLQQHGVSRLG